ncbi:unnamed protein product, partial [Protopolystoma xenopodis]
MLRSNESLKRARLANASAGDISGSMLCASAGGGNSSAGGNSCALLTGLTPEQEGLVVNMAAAQLLAGSSNILTGSNAGVSGCVGFGLGGSMISTAAAAAVAASMIPSSTNAASTLGLGSGDETGSFYQSKLSIAEKLTQAHTKELVKRSGANLADLVNQDALAAL